MAASLGLLNTHIFFYEHWIPYTEAGRLPA
ncbi:MAG: hypothetical protein KatS3mg057_2667 [Herpetosiphonaceae bacterium]|nr:MAG: hypothetical protein KatS3mg057_2667 [Herpetosiphonaceae bacterium]